MSDSAVAPPGLNAAVDPRRWKVLALLGLVQFMFLLDSTIVNPALATIQRELHFSTSSLAWVVNGYTLMAGGFLIVGGRVADLLGRRRRHDRTTSSRGMGCASGHVDFSSARTTCW